MKEDLKMSKEIDNFVDEFIAELENSRIELELYYFLLVNL